MLQLLLPYAISTAIGSFLGDKLASATHAAQDRKKTFAKAIRSPADISVQVARDYIVQEDEILLATEEIPLDNRFGSRVLVSEHELTRTASISLEIDHKREMGASVKASLWKSFESQASGELAKSMGIDLSSQITRRVSLRFETLPGKRVNYRVNWKQESRRGILEVKIGHNRRIWRLPYFMTYGLYHTVESLDLS
ncbi:MAG: hypothetical protein H7832_02890 [Magnetococcus sp. DMHC-6]